MCANLLIIAKQNKKEEEEKLESLFSNEKPLIKCCCRLDKGINERSLEMIV